MLDYFDAIIGIKRPEPEPEPVEILRHRIARNELNAALLESLVELLPHHWRGCSTFGFETRYGAKAHPSLFAKLLLTPIKESPRGLAQLGGQNGRHVY